MRKAVVLIIIITLPIPGIINIASRLLSHQEHKSDDLPILVDTSHIRASSSLQNGDGLGEVEVSSADNLVGMHTMADPTKDPDDERNMNDAGDEIGEIVNDAPHVSSVKASMADRYNKAREQTNKGDSSRPQDPEQAKVPEHWKSSIRCPDLKSDPRFPDLLAPDKDSWQTVTPDKSFVYSAFTDPRKLGKTFVNVFGIIEYYYREYLEEKGKQAYCQVWPSGESGDVYVFPAKIFRLSRDVETYASGTFTCVLPFTHVKLDRGTRVSIVEDACSFPTNSVNLHVNVDTGKYETDFTLCLCGPLKNGYKDYGEYVSWKEIHMMFGAKRYVMYDHSASPYFKRATLPDLAHGLMDYHEWNIPKDISNVSNYTQIWNFGQIALVNDCLYRYMFRTKYLVFDDLDELIVPRCEGCQTWHDMMAVIETNCSGKIHFSFRNVFFPTQESSDMYYIKDHEVAYMMKITPLLKARRQKGFMEHNDRSKFIYNPRGVKWTNIHNIYTPWEGSRADVLCVVDPAHGALHHYRQFWKERGFVRDSHMQKFGDDIIHRFLSAQNTISEFRPNSTRNVW